MRYDTHMFTAQNMAEAVKMLIDDVEAAWIMDHTAYESGERRLLAYLAAAEDGVSVEEPSARQNSNYATLTVNLTSGTHFRVDVYGPFDPPDIDKHD